MLYASGIFVRADNMSRRVMNNHVKGILCILAAAVGFSLMSVFVRLSGDLPTMQKAFFRNAVAIVVAGAAIVRSGERIQVGRKNWPDLLMRCAFGTLGILANFYAIDKLGLSDANMLNKLSPFFAILISIPLLKEIPSGFDVISTVIAFIGALFIIRPSADMSFLPALIGLAGGFGAGTAYSFVRRLGKNQVKTPVIVFFFSVFSCLITLPGMILQFQPMKGWQLLCLVLAGVSAAMGQFGITTAYKFAPAKDISVFDYTQVVFAALWGILLFHELPTSLSVVGYVIIIGIAVIRWQHARSK